jgi:hypothetical protein
MWSCDRESWRPLQGIGLGIYVRCKSRADAPATRLQSAAPCASAGQGPGTVFESWSSGSMIKYVNAVESTVFRPPFTAVRGHEGGESTIAILFPCIGHGILYLT